MHFDDIKCFLYSTLPVDNIPQSLNSIMSLHIMVQILSVMRKKGIKNQCLPELMPF